jgi:predicted AAA+ superfamily ATPase
MLIRTAIKRLTSWNQSINRKPLVLRGARQVGKSTLVRTFAKELGLDLLEINLEKQRALNKSFKTLDLKTILQELEFVLGKKIPPNGLLFLDEIQATPWALAALRYFFEEMPELAVIAAGSLLEFTLSEHEFSMPVGRVETMHLGPMNFEEYLMAFNEDQLVETLLKWSPESGQPFSEIAHDKLSKRLREFLFVGGMPEAVREFRDSGSFLKATEVQESILATYQNDFSKYATKNELIRLQEIFVNVPRQLGRKIKYSTMIPGERSADRIWISRSAMARAGAGCLASQSIRFDERQRPLEYRVRPGECPSG